MFGRVSIEIVEKFTPFKLGCDGVLHLAGEMLISVNYFFPRYFSISSGKCKGDQGIDRKVMLFSGTSKSGSYHESNFVKFSLTSSQVPISPIAIFPSGTVSALV